MRHQTQEIVPVNAMKPKKPGPDAPHEPAAARRDPPAAVPAADLLFRRHHKDVLRIVRRLLGPNASQHDVEDVAQQAFISAYRSLPAFRGESSASTWLYQIAVSSVLMHLRSWRRRRRTLQAFIEQWKSAGASSSADLEQRIGQREELARVWAHLERLSAKKRIVFLLYEVEGLTCPEIAEVLSLEPATVATRLHHARKEILAAMRKGER